MKDMVQVEGTSSETSSQNLLLERMAVALERMAASPAAKTNTSPTFASQPSRDAWAIAWMLTLPKPTKTAIALAMGYTHASALAKLDIFNEFYAKFSALETVTGGGFFRPGGSRRNGKSSDRKE